jgi:replicative DNA helicase
LSLDQDGKLVPVCPADVFEKGMNDVWEIRTNTGRRLKATASHPILTAEGWKKVSELKLGTLVATARRLPVFEPEPTKFGSDRMRLLGYLLGDGSYQRRRAISFISADPLTFDDCLAVAEREFKVIPRRFWPKGISAAYLVAVYPPKNGSSVLRGRPDGNPLRLWLRDLGVEGQTAPNKRVPNAVFFDAAFDEIRALLRAMFSTDGCLTRRVYGNGAFLWALHYDSASLGLVEDVRDLLLRFGILSGISSGYKGKLARVPIYRAAIEDSGQLHAFCSLIGIEGRKGNLVNQCLAELAGRRHKPRNDRLPYSATEELWLAKERFGVSWGDLGFRLQRGKTLDRARAVVLTKRLGNDRITRMASSDIFWDRVTTISFLGNEIVYDLVMPETHNYIANGLVSHNSGELEQVADLVLFIYREDYYNEQTEKKNIAEIHIAKHRNGPTGTVELYFDREHSRFMGLDRRRGAPSR